MRAGILPIVALCTLVATCAVVVVPLDRMRSTVILVAVIFLGVGAGFLWARRAGADAIHARVAAARARWAASWDGAVVGPDAAADPRDVALALPRSWRVRSARGRVRFAVDRMPVRAETWVLEPGPGSKRSSSRREVVGVDVPTGPVRLWVPLGSSVDPLLVTPSWLGHTSEEPVWLPTVRDRVAAHRDILASLTIGDDRVILLALDDPRPDTMLERAQLLRDVAVIIQVAHGRP
jgi:hypothetical protein